jgi:hypothetical protein
MKDSSNKNKETTHHPFLLAIIFSALIGKILISLFTGRGVIDWLFWIILLLFLAATWFTFGNILKSKASKQNIIGTDNIKKSESDGKITDSHQKNDQILETKTNLNKFFGYLGVIGIVLFILEPVMHFSR